MNSPHIHLLLNHIPTVGFAVGLGLCLLSFLRKSDHLQQASLELLFVVSLLTLPTYLSGYSAKMGVEQIEGVSAGRIQQHLDAALLAFLFMQLTGAFAWFALWQQRRSPQSRTWMAPVALALAIVTFGVMARAANLGGDIRHPEIVSAAPEDEAAAATGGEQAPAPSFLKTAQFASALVIDHPWAWPICETLHFIGLSFLLGVLLLVDLRLLGMGRHMSAASLHALLPWAAGGYAVNTITGILWVSAAPEQYLSNPAFYYKIIFVVLAGINVLFLTVYDKAWEVRSGEEAPGLVKLLAATSIVFWFGVLAMGRLMPFLGLTF